MVELELFTKSFCTTNGLLMVDCRNIRDSIVPKLGSIFRQLSKMVAKDLMRMSKKFIDEAQQLVRSVEHQARVVGKRATSGEFLISEHNSSLMISSLMKLLEKLNGSCWRN
ncbi:uncharacterized protein LOC124435791 isoform X2 [Xenia sp. Carnegie-2017]|uniref:uncharacterized protein LOC124435791 isoform X2 n=1 Tax=Xenia sp. Carnegie-2017 TaxID=2897299 RepID=UPI001F04CAEB|nr:uncharacterized protein LOC124435791 isoform X2 [Xenia sp. Carnegie-2017]